MRTVTFERNANGFATVELIFSPEVWEQLKKSGDMELYKKNNHYANYSELRIHINDRDMDIEAHCIIENKKRKRK
jgi:hypothetical protein